MFRVAHVSGVERVSHTFITMGIVDLPEMICGEMKKKWLIPLRRVSVTRRFFSSVSKLRLLDVIIKRLGLGTCDK